MFGPAITKRLMNYFATPRPSVPKDAFPELTDREREILNCQTPTPQPEDRPQPRLEHLH
jgi:hypothetical protein